MAFTKEQLHAVMTGTDLNRRVEALRQLLGYPVKELDPEGSRFWYLRPGADEEEAEETCPIAIAFYPAPTQTTDRDIKTFLTSVDQEQWLCGHYTNRVAADKPVMYLLLPEAEQAGRVAMVLPGEGRKLRHRQIQTFAWNEEDLQARLARLQQDSLRLTNRIKPKALLSMPLVEWAFYKPIETARELAQLLAKAAREIEQVIPKVYNAEGTDGYLHKLLLSFQKELLPTLKLTSDNEKDYSFADIYAQTIAYALFTARVFGYVKDKREGREKETHFDRESAWQQLPETNPFLRKLFQDVSERSPEELGDELVGAIAEIFGILRAAKMDAILSDFQMKRNREDIVIRFYEDFLAAYKPKMRERQGVYYTPEPVVSYMVRSVDEMLKDKFNKPLGLADPEVMILDPACGTGTFLLWICRLIYQRFQESPEALTEGLVDKSWSGYVKERLLPRIFGFELLMAPYAIAHLKLGLFLEETGYDFYSDERLCVYLTNCLEQSTPDKPKIPFQEFIVQEGQAALEIKRNAPIMLVIGNPPYSASNFEGSWIMNLLKDYKEELNEKKSDLKREEWKFLRFAQDKIENVGQGIVSFVINNTFLDAVTHRSLRKSLIKSFDEIAIFDLHGSIKKQEKCPDGSKDEGVFDIQQGVAIATFIRHSKRLEKAIIQHADCWGLREKKYIRLNLESIDRTYSHTIIPENPHFFLSQKNLLDGQEFKDFWSLTKIFSTYGSGIKTDRDTLFIDLKKSQLDERMRIFYSNECFRGDFKFLYRVEDSSSYKLLQRRQDTVFDLKNIHSILYRPFDYRSIYYSTNLTSRPAWAVMRHMITGDNLALICSRQQSQQGRWSLIGVTEKIAECCAISNKTKEMNYLFPLHSYPETEAEKAMEMEKRPNISPEFYSKLEFTLGYTPTPETIFYYIYAIFHSPTYRTRYAEFLKIDFPRVPLTSDNKLFCQLSAYGEELVALHLMKSPKLDKPITKCVEANGNRIVDAGHPKYSNGTIIINKKGDRFTGVPENVWHFHVGGY